MAMAASPMTGPDSPFTISPFNAWRTRIYSLLASANRIFLLLICIGQPACWQWIIRIVNKLLFHPFRSLIAAKTMRTIERNDPINTYLACLDF